MVSWVMTPSNLILIVSAFWEKLVRLSSLSKCSVPIILFRVKALEILEEIFSSKVGKN